MCSDHRPQQHPVIEDTEALDDDGVGDANDNDGDDIYLDLPPLSEPENVVGHFWATSPEGTTTADLTRAFSQYQKRLCRAASSRTAH